jgi:glycosyltransferase involved in cell wall biosynthesis
MPALSVVVPLHDVAPYLPQLVSTAARTERDDVEFVLVDDHSGDGTPAVAEGLLPALPHARLLRLDGARGVSAARNLGIRESTADAITFFDGDDWVAPGYLDRALALWERRDVDVMRFDYVRQTGVQRELAEMPVGRRGEPVLLRALVNPVHRSTVVDFPNVWSGIIRRSFLEQHGLTFDEMLATAEDREWWWRVVLADPRASYERLAGYFYRRQVQSSLTQIGDERQLHYMDAMERIIARVEADRDAELLLPKIWRTYLALMLFHHRSDARLRPDIRREHIRRTRIALQAVTPSVRRRAMIKMPQEGQLELIALGLPPS